VTLRETKDHVNAAQAFVEAAATADAAPHTAHLYYDAALEYARADRNEDAAQMLKKAFDAGFADHDVVNKVPELAKVKMAAR
jgi:hypothetical protein